MTTASKSFIRVSCRRCRGPGTWPPSKAFPGVLQELGRRVPEISLSHLTASALWRGWEDGQGFRCPLRLWVPEWCWHQACRLGKQASPLSVPSARARQAGCRAQLGSRARQHWPLLLPRWRLGVCVGVSGRRVWVLPILQVCLEGCAEWLGAWAPPPRADPTRGQSW